MPQHLTLVLGSGQAIAGQGGRRHRMLHSTLGFMDPHLLLRHRKDDANNKLLTADKMRL